MAIYKRNKIKIRSCFFKAEFSEVIYDFLYDDKPWLVKWIRKKWDNYLSKFIKGQQNES
jgi:hypothetical protein